MGGTENGDQPYLNRVGRLHDGSARSLLDWFFGEIRPSIWFVVAIFAGLCLVKLWYLPGFPVPFVWGDSYLYANRALNLAQTGTPLIENYFGPSYPPLYSILLTPAYLFSRDPETAHRLMLLLNILLNSSLVFPLYLIGRRLGRSSLQQLIAAVALAAILPGVAGFSFAIMAENLYIPLLAWTVFALLGYLGTPTALRGLGLGLCVAATVLTKSFGLVLIPVLVVAVAIAEGPRREKAGAAIACLAGAAIPILAWQFLSPETPAAVAPWAENYPLFSYLRQLALVLHRPEVLSRFLQLAANQFAYLLLGSFLLLPAALTGADPGASRSPISARFRLVLGLLIAASLVLSVLHSLVQLPVNPARYTLMPRYLDPLLPLVVLVGIVSLEFRTRWRTSTAVLIGLLGIVSAVTIPCVDFGVVDRMSLSFVTASAGYLPCRPALILLAVCCFFGLVFAPRRGARLVFLAGLVSVAAFGSWMAIRAERSLSRYHDREAASARWVEGQLRPGYRLVLDLRDADPSQPRVRSSIWRLLFELQSHPILLDDAREELAPGSETDVVLVRISCLLEADADNLRPCVYVGPFGNRPNR